jgi:hypothetical protein
MRRRLASVIGGLFLVLSIAGPAFADTMPQGPGDRVYFNADSFVCGQSTCTETFVSGDATNLKSGESFSTVCVDQFTFPAHGGNRVSSFYGCADVPIDVAHDGSTASASAHNVGETCGRRSCTTQELDLSVSLVARSEPSPYSYSFRNKFDTCTESGKVTGASVEAEGTVEVNGTSSDAFGGIGAESFTYTIRCR